MRMKNKKFTIGSSITKGAFLLAFSLSSCDFFKFKSEEDSEDNPIVASVSNQQLRLEEVSRLNTTGLNAEDSIGIVSRYIQSWVRKHLMINEASRVKAYDQTEIDRKLLDYKYALMVYEYEKAYLEENLNQTIPTEEIEAYYEAFQGNFSLREIIVRINFLRMDKSSSQNAVLERLLKLSEGEQQSELEDIALRQASNYYLEDNTWVRFEDIIVNTPLADHPNKVTLVRNNKLIVVEDDTYKYYFRILEYKLQDQIPPLQFVSDEISKILLNKKRVELIEQHQKEIYNRAQENNEFKIYE